MLSLYQLFKVVILFINALAILNERRFLAPLGWDKPVTDGDASVKSKLIGLLYAVRMVAQIPLIIANVLLIVVEVLFG